MSRPDTPSLACRLLRLLEDGSGLRADQLQRAGALEPGELDTVLDWLARHDVVTRTGPGDTVRLLAPVDMLDPSRILEGLPAGHAVQDLVVLDHVDSTNSWLLNSPWSDPGRGRACLAEWQSAGRGRRGRSWQAPLGGGLCLSLGWHFPGLPPDPGCLSLACGLAVAQALEALGVVGVGLKWPNDLLWQDRKLGGLLVETRSSSSGGFYAVVGLGLNVRLGEAAGSIRSGWGGSPADLAEAMAAVPGRNALAAAVLGRLAAILSVFQSAGFEPLRGDWEDRDCLRGRTVRVAGEQVTVTGVAMGLDPRGQLRLQSDGQIVHCLSGDVSVRPGDALVD